MATPAQIAANRRNSQSSTGPRTAAGKAASSRNSTCTGLYAKSLVIEGEAPDDFAALQQDYFESCDPQGPREAALVLELLRCDWLLRRMATVETQLWNLSAPYARDREGYQEITHFAHVYYRIEDQLEIVQRRVCSLSRSYHRALQDLARLQSLRIKRPVPPAPQDPAAEIGFVPSPPDPARQPIGFVPPKPLHPSPHVLNLSSSYSSQIANPRRSRPRPFLSFLALG